MEPIFSEFFFFLSQRLLVSVIFSCLFYVFNLTKKLRDPVESSELATSTSPSLILLDAFELDLDLVAFYDLTDPCYCVQNQNQNQKSFIVPQNRDICLLQQLEDRIIQNINNIIKKVRNRLVYTYKHYIVQSYSAVNLSCK